LLEETCRDAPKRDFRRNDAIIVSNTLARLVLSQTNSKRGTESGRGFNSEDKLATGRQRG
jgi:hypothetical protein